MLKVYGVDFSRTYRVLWMVAELGVPHEHHPVSFRDGGHRSPGFLAINPNGRLPAIDDDGVILWESLAINLYLAKKHGGSLAPRDVVEDGEATMWSFWALTEVEKISLRVMANRTVFPPQYRREDDVIAAMEELARPFAVLDGVLSDRVWLVGDRFTVADLNVAAIIAMVALANADLSSWPNLKAWSDRCLERPAAQACRAILKFTMDPP